MMKRSFLLLFVLFSFAVIGCSRSQDSSIIQYNNSEVVSMKLSSPSFSDNGMIPAKYTCNGINVNPELAISDVPTAAKSLALIVDDPDAPSKVWVHWVVFNISPKTTAIVENSFPSAAVQGTTDFRTAKYGGPCPPSGTHRYVFKLYALDTTLSLSSSATKADVEVAMKGHVINQATLTGLYRQQK